MSLNRQIIIFPDIDYNNSNIYIRMMLRGDKIIKKYKEYELKVKELSIKNKEKKILSLPYNSKLTFNYTLTNDKNIMSAFIKDAKDKNLTKKQKSIFETNDDGDENCQEESENSDEEKNDNSNSASKEGSNNNIIKVEKYNEQNEQKFDFKQRLSIFQKSGIINNNKNQPQKVKTNIKKENQKIEKNDNKNDIKRRETFIPMNKTLKNNDLVKLFENNIHKIGSLNKNNPNKNIENSTKKNDNINKNENIKNDLSKKDENNINKNVKTANKIENNKKPENINKSEIIKNNNDNKKNEEVKNNLNKNDKKAKKKDSNINPAFLLHKKEINIEEEYNLESFCNYFFICSFPYNNGKVIENSKDYNSICRHPICCKLLAMVPEIIYKYPLDDNNDLELNNLASICFPAGIKICYNQDRRTIYKSFSTHIINQQGQKYYMTVYHFYRQLDSLTYNKLYSDNPLKLYLRQFGDNTYKNKQEKAQLEKDLEECQELAFREYSYIPYALALISKYPYINQMKACLNIIYRIFTNNEDILNNLEENIKKSLINNILAYLIYGIPIPNINSEISFNMPLSLNKITIATPYKNNIRNLENINFGYILSYFCPENIIKIYQFMLFEQKILFIDKEYNRLTIVIDSFINILYPIDWENTVIPIMSDQMTRYLQTFLPFINGISDDLFKHNASNALKEAEEGVFLIDILKDNISYSKPNSEEDVLSSMPKLPSEVYKKLYSELSDLQVIYKNLTEKEKETYCENINNITKNIFLETVCILLYGLMDYILKDDKEYNGIKIEELFNIYKNDANFYKELTETQLFQNFIQNFLKRKKDYSLFITMLKNITEKYIKSVEKSIFKWKKTIRNIEKKDIIKVPIIFKIPLHLLNQDEKSFNTYSIEKEEWTNINNFLEDKIDAKMLSNDIIAESERIALTINQIDTKLNPSNEKMERFFLSEENEFNDRRRTNRINTTYISKKSDIFDKLLKLNYVKANNYLKQESYLSKDEQDQIKNNFKETLTCILKNQPAEIEECLKNVYYTIGRDILCKLLFQKGFKVVKKLNEECFTSLNKICINAFVAISSLEENEKILEFAVKITSSAFCYCKEKDSTIFLIDELRKNLGKDYFMWNKYSFWNTWQILENYFSINEYAIYCQVIIHDFSNKLLRLKLDKDFIKNYLISSLGEKLFLLQHTYEKNQDIVNENKNLFNENRTIIIDLIDNS